MNSMEPKKRTRYYEQYITKKRSIGYEQYTWKK
jgi:hypothetical protein